MGRWLIGFVLVALLAGATLLVLYDGDDEPEQDPTPVARALGGSDTAGYQRADQPRPLRFPQDHGAHPGFRNEWWYLTGNLDDEHGRRFGYQLTLFRIALTPTEPTGTSAWRTNQVYMGHLALTDVAGGRHLAFQRFARGALGLAGARAQPFRVWLEDWSVASTGETYLPLYLEAGEGDVALSLVLEAGKPVVLQGQDGFSAKSAAPGNASYYYSLTRLPTRGSLRVGGQTFVVRGASWLDREWSTSALGPEQSGWDWFALQLEDGRDLMYYRLRLKDGGVDPHSAGVLVAPDGGSRRLEATDVHLEALAHWRSPHSGDRYPVSWRLKVPDAELDLTVRAVLDDQEMRLVVRYWEGAVDVEGTAGAAPVSGRGYLEMTRYEGEEPGSPRP